MKGFSIHLSRKEWFLVYTICSGFLLLIYLVFIDIKIQQYIYNNRIVSFPLSVSSLTSYPILTVTESPNISALAAIVIDDDSKAVLFSKNPTLLFSMASTTKIMTALVALSYYKMGDVLTVHSDNVEGVTIGFTKGQRVLLKDLLYAMLLPSANDAALALAQNYPGGESAFVNKMNELARSFHLYNTHFGDAAGLLDDKDYTTPLDLVRLSSL